MISRWFSVIYIILCFLGKYTFAFRPNSTAELSPDDPNSFSRPDEIEVKHIQLFLKVDFERKILSGSALLTSEAKSARSKKLTLDTSGLNIQNITNVANGRAVRFKMYDAHPLFGSKMEVTLTGGRNSTSVINISYETSPNASALQWLSPEQTAGKVHPYLFSQCQAIHCRSMLPCQDTPAVKTSFYAEITAPGELVVLMSGLRQGEPMQAADGYKVHKFRQDVPMPSYLIAIAVGALESRQLGPRSRVWSETETIEQSAKEFEDTETMLSTAEAICGSYMWGIYDLLVLPPSFPYGGMENPCLTFVTPALLAGDKSLADVIAHEISHSWTGNLVTNRNFEHFWLNEGFTSFIERKILGRLYGDEHRRFSAFSGLKDLSDAVAILGETNPLTQLVVDLKNITPDDSFSSVPYEKGHTFLYYLEQLLGGPEIFDQFLRSYLVTFRYKSIDTDDFKNYLNEYFPLNEKLKEVNWDTWLYGPGMPPVIPDYSTQLEFTCSALTQRWVKWSGEGESPFSGSDIESMSSPQITEFLSQVLLEDPFSVQKLQAMQQAYAFSSSGNAEILYRWLRLCVRGKWSDQITLALNFVSEQGRMKYVRPIYRDLYAWDEARDQAIATFTANAPSMMYVSAHAVAQDLNVDLQAILKGTQ